MIDDVVGEGVIKQMCRIMNANKGEEKPPLTKREDFAEMLRPFAKTLESILRAKKIKFAQKLDAPYFNGKDCYPHCYVASASSVDLVIEREGILTAYVPPYEAENWVLNILTDYKEETLKQIKIKIKI